MSNSSKVFPVPLSVTNAGLGKKYGNENGSNTKL